MFEKIKKYYELGIWDEERVRAATIKGAITEKEFTAITGKGFLESK